MKSLELKQITGVGNSCSGVGCIQLDAEAADFVPGDASMPISIDWDSFVFTFGEEDFDDASMHRQPAKECMALEGSGSQVGIRKVIAEPCVAGDFAQPPAVPDCVSVNACHTPVASRRVLRETER